MTDEIRVYSQEGAVHRGQTHLRLDGRVAELLDLIVFFEDLGRFVNQGVENCGVKQAGCTKAAQFGSLRADEVEQVERVESFRRTFTPLHRPLERDPVRIIRRVGRRSQGDSCRVRDQLL